jgi:hypothetical protein
MVEMLPKKPNEEEEEEGKTEEHSFPSNNVLFIFFLFSCPFKSTISLKPMMSPFYLIIDNLLFLDIFPLSETMFMFYFSILNINHSSDTPHQSIKFIILNTFSGINTYLKLTKIGKVLFQQFKSDGKK